MTQDLVARIFEIAKQAHRRVRTTAAGQAQGGLSGLCAHAALDLMRALQGAGLAAEFVVGQNHCFCQVGNLIVDITAEQFRNVQPVEGVWIADALDPEMQDDPGVWRPSARFSSPAAVLAAPIWSSWPECERPSKAGLPML